MGYSKAPEQLQSSARPICHSHTMASTGHEPATIRIAAYRSLPCYALRHCFCHNTLVVCFSSVAIIIGPTTLKQYQNLYLSLLHAAFGMRHNYLSDYISVFFFLGGGGGGRLGSDLLDLLRVNDTLLCSGETMTMICSVTQTLSVRNIGCRLPWHSA